MVACSVGYAIQLHDVELFQIKEVRVGKDSKAYGYMKLFSEQVQGRLAGLVKVE